MKQGFLRAEFVEYIPERLVDGVIYVSQRYRTATHRCCCGCGKEVVTPFGPADWSMQVTNGAVTLYPSIGNWSLECRSHYWIREGKVIWAAPMSRQQIERGRVLDQRGRDAYFAEVNRQKEDAKTTPPQVAAPAQQSTDWVTTAWLALKKWLSLPD